MYARMANTIELFEAVRGSDIKRVQELINGKEIDLNVEFPKDHPNASDYETFNLLHFAVLNSDIPMINLLVKSGANINIQKDSYHTPLSLAIENLNTDIIKCLVDAGGDLNYKETNGYSYALTEALYAGPEIVKLVIDLGANVNLLYSEDQTVLHKIFVWSMADKKAIFDILLSNGININAIDCSGYTALHYAIMRFIPDRLYYVERLLEHGIDLSVLDNKQDDYVKIARKHDEDASQLIEKYMIPVKGVN